MSNILKGIQGIRGRQGIQGEAGINGKDGAMGIQGIQGPAGQERIIIIRDSSGLDSIFSNPLEGGVLCYENGEYVWKLLQVSGAVGHITDEQIDNLFEEGLEG